MSNIVKDKLIDFLVTKDGKEKGVADVTLPDLEYLSDTLKGAGINGEVDMPTLGMLAKMSITINWRTINGDITDLTAPKAHDLTFTAAQQEYESGAGELNVKGVKVVVRALPKKTGLGKLSPSATTDSSNEMECIYFKMSIDGTVKVEIDKFGRKCVIDGIDYYAPVRKALGLN